LPHSSDKKNPSRKNVCRADISRKGTEKNEKKCLRSGAVGAGVFYAVIFTIVKSPQASEFSFFAGDDRDGNHIRVFF